MTLIWPKAGSMDASISLHMSGGKTLHDKVTVRTKTAKSHAYSDMSSKKSLYCKRALRFVAILNSYRLSCKSESNIAVGEMVLIHGGHVPSPKWS